MYQYKYAINTLKGTKIYWPIVASRVRMKEGRSSASLALTGMLFHNLAKIYENDLCKHSKLKGGNFNREPPPRRS